MAVKDNIGEVCELGRSLENDMVEIGVIDESQIVLGKPFPLVLTPREGAGKMNFI